VTLVKPNVYARMRRDRGLNGSDQAVRKAIKTGRITLINGLIDPEVADIQWEKNTQHRRDYHGPREIPAAASKPAEASATTQSWADSKARTEAAVAEMKELELARRKGDLVDRAGVERAAYQTGRQMQKAIVDIFPSRVAVELATITDPWAVECFLREQLRSELRCVAGEAVA